MDNPLVTFEGNTEYLVVDTALTRTAAELPRCDTHNLTDRLVIEKQRQHQHSSPVVGCTSSNLPVQEVATDRDQQQLTRLPANLQTIEEIQQPLPTYRFDVVADTATSTNALHANVTTQIVMEGADTRGSGHGSDLKNSVTSSMHNYSSRMMAEHDSTESNHPADTPNKRQFHCYQCKLQFISEQKVVVHFRSAHSRITCHHCRLMKFDSYGAYFRHVKESHVQCDLCHVLLKHRTALQKHLSRYHPNRSDRFKVTCRETNCMSQFVSLSELTIHLKVDHHLPIVAKSVTVSTWEAAQQWILTEELAHNVKFVVRNNYRSGQSTIHKYWCYWNGLFQRTKEINQPSRPRIPQCVAFCTIDADNTRARYAIKACLSHYGHPVDSNTVRCSFGACDQIGLINHHTNRMVRYFKPSNEDHIAQQWLTKLNVREKRGVLVCSRHFRPKDFDIDLISNMFILNTRAIPSVFGDATNTNDPFNTCGCQHSHQCPVQRENHALRARVAVLTAEVTRLQGRSNQIDVNHTRSPQNVRIEPIGEAERITSAFDDVNRTSNQRGVQVTGPLLVRDASIGQDGMISPNATSMLDVQDGGQRSIAL